MTVGILAHSYTDSLDFEFFVHTVTRKLMISSNICTQLQGFESFREIFAHSYRDAKGFEKTVQPYRESNAFEQLQVRTN